MADLQRGPELQGRCGLSLGDPVDISVREQPCSCASFTKSIRAGEEGMAGCPWGNPDVRGQTE